MSPTLWAALFGGSLLAFAVLLTLACLRMRAIDEPTEPQTFKQYLGLAPDTTLDDLADERISRDDPMGPFEADFWKSHALIHDGVDVSYFHSADPVWGES